MNPRFGSGPTGLPSLQSAPAGLARAAHFRFRKVGDSVVVTNDTGDHVLLTEAELRAFLDGSLPADAPRRIALRDRGFLAGGRVAEESAARLAQRKAFLATGPYLHTLVVTAAAPAGDMSPAMAERSVEVALRSPAPAVTLEFRGEPLANFAAVERAVLRALELSRTARKAVGFSLVTDLSLMDEGKLAFILERGVRVCTFLDGPQDLHDASRPAGAHATTIGWLERINRGYADLGFDPVDHRVEAVPMITRRSLARGRDIVDEYVRRGLTGIFLRPRFPVPAAADGYSTAEFLEFYRDALDHVIARSRGGTAIVERLASIFLVKILTGGDPNYVDIRSPCGAGIGQMTFGPDGTVYCCDEGRLVHRAGDPIFRLGHVDRDGYGDLVESEVVRTLGLASCLEALPGCADCAYMPYCGSCPVLNYVTQRNIFGCMPDNERCRLNMGVMDRIFELMATDPQVGDGVFTRWVEARERPFFAHDY